MDSLLLNFSSLSNQTNKASSFDPSGVNDLLGLLDLEAHSSLSAMDAEHRQAVEKAHRELREAEDHLTTLLEAATAEFRDTSREIEASSAEQVSRLSAAGDAARKSGQALSRAATAASKKFASSATAGLPRSSSSGSKIRPC